MVLRDLEIRAPVGRDRIYKKADERGLYLEVHPNGSKLWRFKYRLAGKDKRIAIGRCDNRQSQLDIESTISHRISPSGRIKADQSFVGPEAH